VNPPRKPVQQDQRREGYMDGLNGKPKQRGRGDRYGQGHAFGKDDRAAMLKPKKPK
jgi:hypothetical protein